MDALMNAVANAAILIAGLTVRFAVAVVLLAILVALLLPFLYAGEGVRRLWQQLAGFESINGLTWRRGTYYSPGHAWIRARADLVRLGLDDLAGRVLRKVEGVAFPEVGTYVREGDALLTVNTGRRGLLIPSPVEGTVTRVNRRLEEEPKPIVEDPYRRGWLVEVQPANMAFRKLRRDYDAEKWMREEAGRLSVALEHATGIVAADGGEFTVPAHLLISEEQRVALEREFLQAIPGGAAGV
jgi:glycine cleavage system H protein